MVLSQEASQLRQNMNPIITFPHHVEPTLRLSRAPAEQWAETLAEERRRLQEDHDALREREENLREYEGRLRVLQAEIEAGRAIAVAQAAPAPAAARLTPAPFHRSPSGTPFADDAALPAAWEKLH